MASYEQIAKRLKRLEDREMGPRTPLTPQPEDVARYQRLLQQRDWSEPARRLFHVWYEDRPGQKMTQEQIRSEETRLLGQLTNEELDTLGHFLEQEVARDGDE
jgi:hypothetical protein